MPNKAAEGNIINEMTGFTTTETYFSQTVLPLTSISYSNIMIAQK
jgi:hypothetical protein